MTEPELSRPLRLDGLGGLPREIAVIATAEECAAVARRFDLISLDSLAAHFVLSADGAALRATGRLTAKMVQACAATAEPVPGTVDDVFDLRFVAAAGANPEDEIELNAHDCDTIEHDGQHIDLGEAVAQSLGLAIDPFVRAPNAEEILRAAGVVTEVPKLNPFAVLAGKKS